MCFYWQEIESADINQELSLEEIEKISLKMGNLIQLSLAGGEPTIRKDLAEICRLFYLNNNVSYITLPTNGLNTDRIVQVVDKIVKECPRSHLRVSLSLDGSEELHDYIRGAPGSYRKLIMTYSELKKLAGRYRNLTIDFATVLQALNKDEIEKLFRSTHSILQPDNHMLMIARGDTKEESARQVPAKVYRQVMCLKEQLYSRKENRFFSPLIRAITARSCYIIWKELRYGKYQIPCVAGKRLIVITEKGDVKPCEILKTSYGNLRDYNYNLKRIMQSTKAKTIWKEIRNKRCHCTFECAINISVIYDWRGYPDLLARFFRNTFHIKTVTGNE